VIASTPAGVGPVVVALPDSLRRRSSLGPFASAHDALKFVAYAASGALVAAALGPLAWLPFIVGGFALTRRHRAAKSLDERAWDYVRYRWRQTRLAAGGSFSRPRARRSPTSRVADVGTGTTGAILRAGGIPIAYLPPPDARRIYDGYAAWLRSIEGPAYLVAGSEPMELGACLPTGFEPVGEIEEARREYRRVLEALAERRRRRRVLVLLTGPRAGGSRALRRLAERSRRAEEALASLEIAVERLSGEPFYAALRDLGLASARPGGAAG
jgi:hypothetical protein